MPLLRCVVLWIGFLGLWTLTPAEALDLRVGTGAGCTHADPGAALFAIRNQTGSHTIRVNKGTYAVPNGILYTPTVNQTAVFLEGGYADCLAAAPSGDPTQDTHRAVFNGAGGTARPVLDLEIYGRIGTFQIRRIKLTGGDATDTGPATDYYTSGGGLIVRGQASVLIGIGTSIRGNAAVSGGGVALAGSNLFDNPSPRVDFFIDEGAEITNNTATDRGGGIYCGGQNPSPAFTSLGDHHGSIVLRDGTISFNDAVNGAAFYCRGSLEGGGGFQPRPIAGRAAWILGNQRTAGSGVGCAAGFGTLDTILPVESDGFRHLGAAAGSNGLVAVTANTADGSSPGLCLLGSRSRSAINDPAPVGQSRFRLRNLFVSDQTGSGFVGLRVGDRLDLIVEPSSDTVTCTFFTSTPCVRFTNNSVATNTDGQLWYANGSSILNIRRAMVDGNSLRPDLAMADDGATVLAMASIFDNNTIARRAIAPETSAFFAARFNGIIDIRNSTIIMRSPLDLFFRLGWTPLTDPTGTGYARASIFASTASPAPTNVGESAPTTNFVREWCGFFQNTADFIQHTTIVDPTTGLYQNHSPSAFVLDANYAPQTLALRDGCTAPTINRDFYGRPYDVNFEPAFAVHADIGAVEAQMVDAVFANGFE